MPRLQNAVMSTWHELWRTKDEDRQCTTAWFKYAYEHTCEGSPLRNVAVDQLAYSMYPEDIQEWKDEIPRELLIDLALAYSKAVWPILDDDDDFQEAWRSEYLEVVPGSLADSRYRYRCTRTWRSYLVPEDF